jgi:hypothetical protein
LFFFYFKIHKDRNPKFINRSFIINLTNKDLERRDLRTINADFNLEVLIETGFSKDAVLS